MVMMLKLLVCVALAVASAEKVTPVQKVIQLLQDMINKGQAAIDAEQVQFSTYSSWCTNINGEKKRAIKKSNEEMEMAEADIQKYSADAAKLGEEIAELDETIATIIGDTNAAMKVRDMEHADFLQAQNDYQQSVDALASGIDTVKAQNQDVSGFVQLAKEFAAHPAVEVKAKTAIMKYLNEDPEDKDVALLQGPGSAKAFGAHLGPIIQMFEEMKDKFEGKVADTEKHETEDNHEFMMLKQDLDNQKATANSARDMKAQLKAEALQSAADSKGNLADATGTRDADTAYLMDTEATCSAKASAFEDRQKLRHEENGAAVLKLDLDFINDQCKRLSELIHYRHNENLVYRMITNFPDYLLPESDTRPRVEFLTSVGFTRENISTLYTKLYRSKTLCRPVEDSLKPIINCLLAYNDITIKHIMKAPKILSASYRRVKIRTEFLRARNPQLLMNEDLRLLIHCSNKAFTELCRFSDEEIAEYYSLFNHE